MARSKCLLGLLSSCIQILTIYNDWNTAVWMILLFLPRVKLKFYRSVVDVKFAGCFVMSRIGLKKPRVPFLIYFIFLFFFSFSCYSDCHLGILFALYYRSICNFVSSFLLLFMHQDKYERLAIIYWICWMAGAKDSDLDPQYWSCLQV